MNQEPTDKRIVSVPRRFGKKTGQDKYLVTLVYDAQKKDSFNSFVSPKGCVFILSEKRYNDEVQKKVEDEGTHFLNMLFVDASASGRVKENEIITISREELLTNWKNHLEWSARQETLQEETNENK